jgi:hypothetical protein
MRPGAFCFRWIHAANIMTIIFYRVITGSNLCQCERQNSNTGQRFLLIVRLRTIVMKANRNIYRLFVDY